MRRFSISRKIFCILLFVHGVITLVLYSVQQDFTIFPSDRFSAVSLTDDYDNGKSTINSFKVSGSYITYRYTARKSDSTPFVSVVLRTNHFFSLKEYDTIILDIEAPDCEQIILSFGVYVPSYTNIKDFSSYPRLEYIMPLKPGQRRYCLSRSNFRLAVEWYSYNLRASSLPIADMDCKPIAFFGVTNYYPQFIGRATSVTIHEIRLVHNSVNLLLKSFLFFLVYSMFFFIHWFLRQQSESLYKKYRNIPVPQETVKLKNNFDSATRKIVIYLGKYYNDPNIFLEMVSSKCSVPEYRITKTLRKLFNLTFPQYITTIRLAEAKRLLKTTDKRIIEIARMVGYIYPNNFNRVFKKSEGISPMEFREQNNKQ